MLDEHVDPEAGVYEGGEDLAQSVVPGVLGLVADLGVRVGIRPVDGEHERLAVLPVRIHQPKLARRPHRRSRTR